MPFATALIRKFPLETGVYPVRKNMSRGDTDRPRLRKEMLCGASRGSKREAGYLFRVGGGEYVRRLGVG